MVDDPDVAKPHWIAVILETDRIRIRRLLLPRASFAFDVEVVVNQNSIMLHGQASVGCFFAL